MASSTTWLTRHLQDLDKNLVALYIQTPQILIAHTAKQERIKEEIDSIKQCLAIYGEGSKRAQQERINVFEVVSMADDGH
jgi:hypothetical protein